MSEGLLLEPPNLVLCQFEKRDHFVTSTLRANDSSLALFSCVINDSSLALFSYEITRRIIE